MMDLGLSNPLQFPIPLGNINREGALVFYREFETG
jgi:hypothetical protein